jgi:peptidoglycan-associated lipoprotein
LAQVDARVSAHDTQIGELDKTSKDALDRAIAAGKLAEGKFQYALVLSDDSVKFPVNAANLSPEAEQRLNGVHREAEGRQQERVPGNPGPHRQLGLQGI